MKTIYPAQPIGRLAHIRKPSPALLVILSVVLISSAACNPTSTLVASKSEQKSGAVLYSDNFSTIPSGWGTWSRDNSAVEYHDGGLRFLINDPQYDYWSVAGKDFTDVQVEVDAIKLNGPDDNDFGVICRYQNKDNFYMMVASSDGYFGIAKMKEGQYHMIGSNQLQYSESIKKGLAVNHVRADCTGSKLRLYVNGKKLAEAEDADFDAGDVGLMAGTYNSKGVEVQFDNFVVKNP